MSGNSELGKKRKERDEEEVIGGTRRSRRIIEDDDDEYEGNGPLADRPLSYRQASNIYDSMSSEGRAMRLKGLSRDALRQLYHEGKLYSWQNKPKVPIIKKCGRCERTGHYAKDCFAKTYRHPTTGVTYPIVDVDGNTHLRGDNPYIHYYEIPPGAPGKNSYLRKYDLTAGTCPHPPRYFTKKWSNKHQKMV